MIIVPVQQRFQFGSVGAGSLNYNALLAHKPQQRPPAIHSRSPRKATMLIKRDLNVLEGVPDSLVRLHGEDIKAVGDCS